MFGHYLYTLTFHGPTQYELASLRSLNTENQERPFDQARTIADACTNHHAENIIPQIMIRLQAKQEQQTALILVEKADTQVACAAKHLISQVQPSRNLSSRTGRVAGSFISNR